MTRSCTNPAPYCGGADCAGISSQSQACGAVNGVCGATHYNCNVGTRASNGGNAATWTWGCNGSCDGTNASCSENKPTEPIGICGSFNSSPTSPATPITYTWINGTGLQVWDSTGQWWYNSAASSPKSFSGIPPGRTVYARTTYNFIYFSATANTTCALPANPPAATINGKLQQKSGIGCYQADATNNFTVQNPTTTTNPSSCVSTSCTVSPNNNAAQTYTCTTIFSSNNCLTLNPPIWPTSATVTLTGVAPPGYTFIGWTPNGSCTPPTNSKTVNAGDTVVNQPITFDFPGNNWIKLKNSSFNGVSITGITVPAFVTNYDADDDGLKYFISGVGGSVLNTTVLPNFDPLNLHYSYPNNWYDSSYPAGSLSMNPSTFLGYVKSRKEHQIITNLNDLAEDKIYLWQGNLTINNQANFNNKKVVLIVTGTATLDMPNFQPANAASAILAQTINFTSSVNYAEGIFIAQTINTGSNTSQGLKIKGNLVAQTLLNNERSWSDTSRPSIFIVFDQQKYLNLLPYLSTTTVTVTPPPAMTT